MDSCLWNRGSFVHWRRLSLAAAIGLLLGASAWAEDAVKTSTTRYLGKVVDMTTLDVTIATAVKNEKVPVNVIESVDFSEEPAALKRARTAIASGRYEEAEAAIEAVRTDDITRSEIKQEYQFYAALAASRLALSGKMEIREAGKLMAEFVKDHPQSFHYLEANEAIGDLLVANMQYADARRYYERVGEAPWPDYKMRAAVAVGHVLLSEGKPQEALKSFEGVLAMKEQDELAQVQRLSATLGKARCLAETKQFDEAVKIARDVIEKANADDASLLARAYNTLGLALARAGRTQEALFAFLHVDTLYSSEGDAHAEALYHLVQVWQDLKKFDRVQETRRVLEDQYKESRWSKMLTKE